MELSIQNIILVLVTVLNVSLGVLIFLRGRKNPVNITFTIFAISVSIWALSNAFFQIVSTKTEAYNWAIISYIAAIVLAGSASYFTSIYPPGLPPPRSFIGKHFKEIIIIATVFTVFFTIMPGGVLLDVDISGATRKLITSNGLIILGIYLFIFLGSILVNLFKSYRFSKGIYKKQIRLILIGFFLAIAFGIFFNLILPLLGIYNFVWLGPDFSAILVVAFAYAIAKHHLMNIKIIATEIFVIFLNTILFVQILSTSNPADLAFKFATFAIAIFLGILLVRSVSNEIKQKEELAKNKKQLEIANKELSQLDKAKNEFLNIASHQLRTPVSVIRGIVSLLREGDMDKMPPETKKHFYDGAWAKCQKLETIINDILNATSFSNRKFSLKGETVAPVDLTELVKKVADGFALEVKERELDLKVLPPAEPLPKVMGQSEFLEEVFVNLINNV